MRRAANGERGAPMERSKPVLSPWAIWLLIALVRHRTRQRWVAEVIRNHLRGEPEALASAGALGQPEELPQQGIVPGMTEWEYRFHGRGCKLTHRITGESIDVDFYDEEGEWFDGWFYCRHLKNARNLAPPERRLVELHPSIDTVLLTLEELKRAGLAMAIQENRAVFTLSDEVVANADVVEAFCRAWSTEGNRFAAAVEVGDWLAAAHRLSDQVDEKTAGLVRARAEQCRSARVESLLRELDSGRPDRYVLFALAEAGAPQLSAIIDRLLEGTASSLMVGALDLIVEQNDPTWCEKVLALFKRLDPDADLPEPAAWMRCGQFLLRHAYRTPDVLTELLKARDREVADAALLVLEHAPPRCLPLFRRALRSSVPLERSKAAAMLAVLDEEWGRREMIEALWESDDQKMTCDCRAALSCSRSPEAHQAVEEWEKRFPYLPDVDPGYSMRDVLLQNCDSFLQYQMDRLHDRVLPLRGRVT